MVREVERPVGNRTPRKIGRRANHHPAMGGPDAHTDHILGQRLFETYPGVETGADDVHLVNNLEMDLEPGKLRSLDEPNT